MDAISMEHVTKRYAGFALNDISLRLPQGCILGLIGENGAGKSTTIRLIMDAVCRDSGTISVLGTDNRSPAFAQTKEDIGIVLDEAFFPEGLNAVQIGRLCRGTYARWSDNDYRQYLTRFALPGDKAIRTFSRGMKMKLAIATALSHMPKLLILDEATSGLDPVVRDEILDIFFDFTREENHSILLSSHILSDLEKVCDYVAFLHQGRLLLCEEKDLLLEKYAVVQGASATMEALPEDAIVSRENGKYGSRALVRRSAVSSAFPMEPATLEDILLFMVKGEMH